eukprot:TRINITY_DN2250_c0_g1_i4.p1 TRINITY_DN2250_c0_g1~~TRINITY_DN2250_c0_g1_i4.p1  ORF type:complete len:133 (-),score=15.82 TRINITY_DN2250_c0_g1_i4:944-1342(-)
MEGIHDPNWREKMGKDPRLPKFRECIADVLPKYRDDDDLLWRIMQCRETIVDCVQMLRDLVQWRETYKPELIQEEEIESSLRCGAFFISGRDKIGISSFASPLQFSWNSRPSYYCRIGKSSRTLRNQSRGHH